MITFFRNIVLDGALWGIVFVPNSVTKREIRKALDDGGVESWGYFFSNEKWRPPIEVDPEAEDMSTASAEYMTKTELLRKHPALTPDMGAADDEQVARERGEAGLWNLENWVEVTVLGFYTPGEDVRKAFDILRKLRVSFFYFPRQLDVRHAK